MDMDLEDLQEINDKLKKMQDEVMGTYEEEDEDIDMDMEDEDEDIW